MPLTGVIDCAFCIYSVQALRDTGALQSLVSSEVLHNDDFVHTGETRLICGVTGEVVSVPLVQVTLDSSLCLVLTNVVWLLLCLQVSHSCWQ